VNASSSRTCGFARLVPGYKKRGCVSHGTVYPVWLSQGTVSGIQVTTELAFGFHIIANLLKMVLGGCAGEHHTVITGRTSRQLLDIGRFSSSPILEKIGLTRSEMIGTRSRSKIQGVRPVPQPKSKTWENAPACGSAEAPARRYAVRLIGG
jgi:hypothetical protein